MVENLSSESWKEVVKRKRNDLLKSIPDYWVMDHVPSISEVADVETYLNSIIDERENKIVHSSLRELSCSLQKGQLSSLEVTRAFCKRASYIQQMCNCCSEIFFERAFQRARELDEYYQKHGRVSGPLHGIPISLKDQINIEGIDSAIGYVSRLYQPVKKSEVSVLAEILKDLGAVFYVKTTTPMAMMSGETHSNIYGTTLNSRNRKLSCGGSSGGEGSLLASHGSVIGFGTDLGGSIRIPSNSQGIFGLKCSSNRLPYLNISNSMANQPIICSVVGPMSNNINDLEYITELILTQNPWQEDPRCLPISWKQFKLMSKISFGVFYPHNFGYVHPPVRRALEMTIAALKRDGNEIIFLNPPFKLEELHMFAGEVFCSDGGKEINEECRKSGEPLTDISILDSQGNRFEGVKSINNHWDQFGKKYHFQCIFDKFIRDTASLTFNGSPIEAIILPVQASPSFRPGDSKIFKSSFTRAFNVLDYSAVAIPVTVCDKRIDKIDQDYLPIDENDRAIYEYYDVDLYHGTPVGLQVVSFRYQEEKAIALSKLVSDSLRRHK